MLRKVASDFRLMTSTLAGLPDATKRTMVIVGVSVMVVGAFAFWPDIASTVGFAVTANLTMLALMSLMETWNGMRPEGGHWDDGWSGDEGDDAGPSGATGGNEEKRSRR